MKDYDKNKKLSYIQYWEVNNLFGWAILRKLPVNNFERLKDTSQFNESFIKNYTEWILKLMSLPIFLRDIHAGNLSMEKSDNKQINFANELQKIDKGIKYLEKSISK